MNLINAIKCSKLASEVMASFTIAEALLLHDDSSIHCLAFTLNSTVNVNRDVIKIFFIINCFLRTKYIKKI